MAAPVASPPVERLRRLWRGEMPLAGAFWEVAVLGGFVVNLAAFILTMTLVTAGAPGALAAFVHFLPLPYNVLMVVAVWRSAGNAGGSVWTVPARLVVVVWALVLTVL
jgi:hypothetical protein